MNPKITPVTRGAYKTGEIWEEAFCTRGDATAEEGARYLVLGITEAGLYAILPLSEKASIHMDSLNQQDESSRFRLDRKVYPSEAA